MMNKAGFYFHGPCSEDFTGLIFKNKGCLAGFGARQFDCRYPLGKISLVKIIRADRVFFVACNSDAALFGAK